jgi:undecaprenyl pyrophosphate phosphatase UppP
VSDSKESAVTEFLIAEFNALQDRAIGLEQRKSSRINFFLVVTAAAVAGLANLIDNPIFQIYHPAIVALAAIPLLVLGVFTLNQCVDDSVSIVAYYRRAGRIRLWFVQHNVEIEPYVAFHYGDDRPRVYLPYVSVRGGEAVVLVINVALFCAMVVALLAPASWPIAMIEIVVTALLAWFLQVTYLRKKLQRAEKKVTADVHFPHEKMKERIKFTANQR